MNKRLKIYKINNNLYILVLIEKLNIIIITKNNYIDK